MNKLGKIKKKIKKLMIKNKPNGTISLIGDGKPGLKVCDIVNGKPKVATNIKGDIIEYILTYSIFHKEIKRYDKNTFKEIK